jgi:hypothetical protein
LGTSCCREKAHAVGCKEAARAAGKEGLQGRAESAGGSVGVDLGGGQRPERRRGALRAHEREKERERGRKTEGAR